MHVMKLDDDTFHALKTYADTQRRSATSQLVFMLQESKELEPFLKKSAPRGAITKKDGFHSSAALYTRAEKE